MPKDDKTGYPPPELMQDDDKKLSTWLSTRLGALGATGYRKSSDGCCHKTVTVRCGDCPYKEKN